MEPARAQPMPRFLIVEAQPAVRGTVRAMLQDMGFTLADEARDGQTALKRLHAARYDFVISDSTLSDMDGIRLVSQVRRGGKPLRDTPVLLMGGAPRALDVVHAAQAGADGFVVMPFTQAALEEKLRVIQQRYHCWPCRRD